MEGGLSIRVDFTNLATGTISGRVTTEHAIGGAISVDPKSGLIYVTEEECGEVLRQPVPRR
jgi:hypothetical protein